jgi:hypothetical protein
VLRTEGDNLWAVAPTAKKFDVEIVEKLLIAYMSKSCKFIDIGVETRRLCDWYEKP